MLSESNKRFTSIYNHMLLQQNLLSSFREVGEAGLPHAEKIIHRRSQDFLSELLSRPGKGIFVNEEAKKLFFKSGGEQQYLSLMVSNQLTAFGIALDSASIVFAHSTLDSIAFQCLKLIFFHDQDAAAQLVKNSQFSLETFEGESLSALKERALQKKLDGFERESLLKKVDEIHSICRPPQGFVAMEDYRYDREFLMEVDELRHSIIHGKEKQIGEINGFAEKFRFLQKTPMYLIALLNDKYDFKIDPYQGHKQP